MSDEKARASVLRFTLLPEPHRSVFLGVSPYFKLSLKGVGKAKEERCLYGN